MMRVAIGGLPKPIGGVTTFISMLCKKGWIQGVIDLYPDPQKKREYAFASDVYQITSKLQLPLIIARLAKTVRVDEFFFNFSTTKSLIILLLIKKRPGVRFSLMLHHGDLSVFWPAVVVRRVLSKFDDVYYLNQSQKNFYVQVGVDVEKLVASSSYVEEEPPQCGESDMPSKVLSFIQRSNGILLCGSGFPASIYRHEWSMKLASEIRNARLILCLYGKGDQLEKFSAVQCSEELLVVWGLSREQFSFVLKASEIYLRPNAVDSFGLAVADALVLGTAVVASDVCVRAEGCILFDSSNFSDFKSSVSRALEGCESLRKSRIATKSFFFRSVC